MPKRILEKSTAPARLPVAKRGNVSTPMTKHRNENVTRYQYEVVSNVADAVARICEAHASVVTNVAAVFVERQRTTQLRVLTKAQLKSEREHTKRLELFYDQQRALEEAGLAKLKVEITARERFVKSCLADRERSRKHILKVLQPVADAMKDWREMYWDLAKSPAAKDQLDRTLSAVVQVTGDYGRLVELLHLWHGQEVR